MGHKTQDTLWAEEAFDLTNISIMRIKTLLFILFFSQGIQSQIVLTSMRGVFAGNSVVPTMFSGGKSSTEGQQLNIQFNCSPKLVIDIFYGGNGSGNQEVQLVQNSCTPASVVDIFY